MRPNTRDQLSLLAWGIGIAALVAADGLFAKKHGLSANFAIRVPAYMAILDYFVIRETRQAKATSRQVAICVIIASVVHLGTAFAFRQTFSDHFRLLVPLEIFAIMQLMVWAVRHLGRGAHRY
jgi:predicted Na+-dependent transporter